jgi:chemosensory pili system protein ChpA (sensor histidine kinase/response regulator)
LREIFLEEAREVVQNGMNALQVLSEEPKNVAELTTLRRAFHTLKGSSRMVGLNEFGEAAWSLEQVLNTWLADQKPATDDLLSLSTDALQAFGRWVDDIAKGTDTAWKASVFRDAGEAMRSEQRLVALVVPDAAVMERAPAAQGAPAQDADILSNLLAIDESAGAAEEVTLDAPTALPPCCHWGGTDVFAGPGCTRFDRGDLRGRRSARHGVRSRGSRGAVGRRSCGSRGVRAERR